VTSHRIATWERNGYDDSDFYAATWNVEAGEMIIDLVGSTRFAGGGTTQATEPWTPEALEAARAAFAKFIYESLKAADTHDVLEFDAVELGVRVVTTAPTKNKVRDGEACARCGGTGRWTNPKSEHDVRECFGCRGSGLVLLRDRKDAEGKQVWTTFQAGVAGVVVSTAAHGSFYRNGYNHPNRNNTTATIRLDDGRIARIPLAKLRLERALLDDEELRGKAERLSHSYNVERWVGCTAWLSTNNIRSAALKLESVLAK
jgi:hypothetical protein